MYKEILLPVDLNEAEGQQKAVGTAIACAKAFDARVHVMTVVPDFGMSIVGSYFPEDFEEKTLENAREALQEFARKSFPKGLSVQHIVGHGTIYQEILRCAGEIEADLIVMASHRPELQDYLIGPNASRVVRHANCSVLVVRD